MVVVEATTDTSMAPASRFVLSAQLTTSSPSTTDSTPIASNRFTQPSTNAQYQMRQVAYQRPTPSRIWAGKSVTFGPIRTGVPELR